jgi:CBS domain-containing protein
MAAVGLAWLLDRLDRPRPPLPLRRPRSGRATGKKGGRLMKVRDLMTPEVVTCAVGDDLAFAGNQMRESSCGGMPVIGEEGEVAGFITDRDICLHLSSHDRRPSQALVADAMHSGVWVCHAQDDVEDALAAMRAHRVRRLPVLDDHGDLAGIVSIDDVAVRSRPLVSASHGPFALVLADTLLAVSHALPGPLR